MLPSCRFKKRNVYTPVEESEEEKEEDKEEVKSKSSSEEEKEEEEEEVVNDNIIRENKGNFAFCSIDGIFFLLFDCFLLAFH